MAGLASARTDSWLPTADRSTVAPSASGPMTTSVAALRSVGRATEVGVGVGAAIVRANDPPAATDGLPAASATAPALTVTAYVPASAASHDPPGGVAVYVTTA